MQLHVLRVMLVLQRVTPEFADIGSAQLPSAYGQTFGSPALPDAA